MNTILPKPGKNILAFKHIQNQVECPIKIYFDFESFLSPINKTSGKTKLYQKHIPSAFCTYVVSHVAGFSMDPVVYVKQGDEDVDKVLVCGKACKHYKTDLRKVQSLSSNGV